MQQITKLGKVHFMSIVKQAKPNIPLHPLKLPQKVHDNGAHKLQNESFIKGLLELHKVLPTKVYKQC